VKNDGNLKTEIYYYADNYPKGIEYYISPFTAKINILENKI
jgi:hypothetical protein